ncbi:MAG TPA: hypothetical protein PLN63_08990 [Paludibacteraceae bacterium]|jgi:hypothetical protein|nr:hypothetical protein [Paludibacteraceae bacterium]HPH63733.1 hypothetical protein [Paludibacteraceae bacterium]
MFDNIKRSYIDGCIKNAEKRKRRNPQFINLDDAKSIVLLFDAERINNKKILDLMEVIGADKKISAWGYSSKMTTEKEMVNIHYFNDKMVSFLKKPKDIIEKNFLSEPADVLIDLSFRELLPLKYLLGISKAPCRCGLPKEGYALYDLEVKVRQGEKEADLLKQILFYLGCIRTK